MDRKLLWGIIVLVLLLVIFLTAAGLMAWQFIHLTNWPAVAIPGVTPTATVTPSPPAPTVTAEPPTPAPTIVPATALPPQSEGGEAGHASPLQLGTEETLTQITLPERDQRLLAMRLTQPGQDIPKVVRETPLDFQVGDADTFWITDNQQTPPRQFQVTATLRYATEHAYWWVQEGIPVNEEGLQRSARQFEQTTYPTNRTFFGSEWSPGVDNDVRVHIFMGNVPGVAGYFSASNEYSRLAEPYSNEREMFFINLNAMQPGSAYFDSVLAHEFQHMIHWHQDRNEDTWVNEGLSELAAYLNGYGSSNFAGAYAAKPDTQLTGWPNSPNAAAANYGGGFLFMAYFLQRYGEEMTRAVVAHPLNGIAGFDAVLAENGSPERFDDVFADFLVANRLQNPTIGDGRWGYLDFTPNPAATTAQYALFPQQTKDTVQQYGADYIELLAGSPITIEFTGTTQVKVINNQAHSGSYQWYSHRGDDTNTRLTHLFDLSNVNSATLGYWTWYDIEEDWDYGYVEISTDGGDTWTILQTPHSATDNPTGNAYGPGYTGTSEGWIEENIDLSAYTGQQVLIRFEYVTDDAVNRPGWAIDDISIPEIDFDDDAEHGPGEWQAEGFVRIDNVLPQEFLVQVIEIGDEVQVNPLQLDESNQGTFTVEGLGGPVEKAVLIISGLTPVTGEPAEYEYTLKAGD